MDDELKGALATYGSLAGTVLATIWAGVAAFRKQRALAMARADRPTVHPVQMLPPPPAAAPSAELVELRARLRDVEHQQNHVRLTLKYELSVEERQGLRIECEALQNALTTERRENEALRLELALLRRDQESVVVVAEDVEPRALPSVPAELLRTPLRPARQR